MTPLLALSLVTLVAFSIPLFALRRGKEWLTALLPIYLITGNVFAESFITVFGFFTSLAIPVYATTFLITDTLSEHYGKADAKRAIFIGFMGQIVFLAMAWAVVHSPIAPDKLHGFGAVFGVLPRVVVGSFTAYIVSQFWDIYIYHLIMQKTGHTRKTLFIRNNLSTWTSQLLDTIIFITIAFYGTPYFSVEFILTTWVIKIIVGVIDTPFLYLTYNVVGRRT